MKPQDITPKTFPVVEAQTRPLREGDLFKTPDGGIFVAHVGRVVGHPTHAGLVFHTDDATGSYEGDEVLVLEHLPQPFTLIMALGEVKA